MIRLVPLLVSGLLLLPSGATAAEDENRCPPTQARAADGNGFRLATAPVPGRLLAAALVKQGDGTLLPVLLVAPPRTDEDDPKDELRLALQSALREVLAREGSIRVPNYDQVAGLLSGLDLSEGCPVGRPVTEPGLFRLTPGIPGALQRIDLTLPEGARAVASTDLDGDGRDELLIEIPGELHAVRFEPGDAGRATIQLLLQQEIRLEMEEPADVRFPLESVALATPFDDDNDLSIRTDGRPRRLARQREGPAHVRRTSVGRLEIFGTPPGGSLPWIGLAEIPLPVRANPDPDLLLLTTPQLRSVGSTPDGRVLLAAGPVPYGSRRLKTVLVSYAHPSDPQVEEVWSRLPEDGERVERSGVLLLDGVPHLWVQSEFPEGMVVFGDSEHAFRLFRLSPDRTRAGVDPVLRIDKAKGISRSTRFLATDVNGDGRDDLLMVNVGRETTLHAHVQKRDGSFSRSPQRQEIPGRARAAAFHDVDSDGAVDLVLVTGEAIRVHAPAGSPRPAHVFEEEPRRQADAGEPSAEDGVAGGAAPSCDEGTLADIDGDGLLDWFCLGSDAQGRPLVRLLTFDTPAAPAP